MSATAHPVFTVGHSTHPREVFLSLLRMHGVEAVADVRSSPFSRFNPQFNREAFEQWLKSEGIQYVFLGRELGARSEDRSCYMNGRVQYARLAQTPLFRSGLDRVIQGAARYRIALMCAEKEPLECHRTLLVAKALAERGKEVLHIHTDGHLETHGAALERLLEVTGVPDKDMFLSREQLLSEALERQEQQVAYVEEAQEEVMLREDPPLKYSPTAHSESGWDSLSTPGVPCVKSGRSIRGAAQDEVGCSLKRHPL